MAKNDVTLTVGADTSGLKNSFKSLNKTILATAAAVATVFAGKKLIDAATQQEKAINALNQSLIRTGEYSIEASQDLQDFASELQNVTTIGDETTLELLALAKSFGVSNEEAKKLVTTAADASVALGVDARTALEQLGGTLSGTRGRLAKFVPEVNELGTEALKSGEAIDIFAKKFAGAATGELQTFDGALTQTTNIFGDLLEELGFFITRSPAVVDAVKGVGEALSGAIAFLSDNQGAIRSGIGASIEILIKGFGFVAQNVLPPLIEGFSLLIAIFDSLSDAIYRVLDAFLGFNFVTEILNSLYNMILAIADVIVENLLGAFQTLARFVGKEIPAIEDALTGVREKIDELGGADASGALKGFLQDANEARKGIVDIVDETLKSIQDGASKIDYDQFAKEFSERIKGKIELNPKVNTSEAEQSFLRSALKWGAEASKSLGDNSIEAAKSFGKSFANVIAQGAKTQRDQDNIIQELELKLADTTDLEERKKIEADITKAQEAQVKAQKNAAAETTKEIGAFVADTLLPGAGQFVKLLFGFAKDPDSFRQFIEGFVQALPEIIKALTDALPIIFEVLAENLDKIILALAQGLVRVVFKLIEGIGRFIGVIFQNIVDTFNKAVEDAFASLGPALNAGLADLFKGLEEGFQDLLDGLNPFSGGGGGGGTLGEIAGGISKSLGFNEGGIIPEGFPNDSFTMPAAESGEMVLTKNQQAQLFDIANGRGTSSQPQSQMITVNLVLNEEVLASQILEINRDNQRIA